MTRRSKINHFDSRWLQTTQQKTSTPPSTRIHQTFSAKCFQVSSHNEWFALDSTPTMRPKSASRKCATISRKRLTKHSRSKQPIPPSPPTYRTSHQQIVYKRNKTSILILLDQLVQIYAQQLKHQAQVTPKNESVAKSCNVVAVLRIVFEVDLSEWAGIKCAWVNGLHSPVPVLLLPSSIDWSTLAYFLWLLPQPFHRSYNSHT